jgi:hypothetical protein
VLLLSMHWLWCRLFLSPAAAAGGFQRVQQRPPVRLSYMRAFRQTIVGSPIEYSIDDSGPRAAVSVLQRLDAA